MANKEAAEDYEGIRLIRTNGIDDVIRCVLCTNIGCEGACQVNEHLYDEVMNAIHFFTMEEDEVNEYLSSRHDKMVIRKFAEWIKKYIHCNNCPHSNEWIACEHSGYVDSFCVDSIMSEYEKQMKGRQT